MENKETINSYKCVNKNCHKKYVKFLTRQKEKKSIPPILTDVQENEEAKKKINHENHTKRPSCKLAKVVIGV